MQRSIQEIKKQKTSVFSAIQKIQFKNFVKNKIQK